MDNFELSRLRQLDALRVLELLADYTKVDRDFHPTTAKTTLRVFVAAADAEWEILVDGPRFYDLRARRGGGGAIDLVMYMWRIPFTAAIKKLRQAGA